MKHVNQLFSLYWSMRTEKKLAHVSTVKATEREMHTLMTTWVAVHNPSAKFSEHVVSTPYYYQWIRKLY